MYAGRDWKPLDVGEGDFFTLDFGNDLPAGDVVQSCVSAVVALRGIDAAPGSWLVGSPAFEGLMVSQEFHGGVNGEKYRLIYTVFTTLRPDGIKLWSNFECRDPTIPS